MYSSKRLIWDIFDTHTCIIVYGQSSNSKLLQSTKCSSWNITNNKKLSQQKDVYHDRKTDAIRIVLKAFLLAKKVETIKLMTEGI